MIYFENIHRAIEHSIVDVVALRCIASDGSTYWRITIPYNAEIASDILSVDTLDEAIVWCDLHNLKITKQMDSNEYYAIFNEKGQQ